MQTRFEQFAVTSMLGSADLRLTLDGRDGLYSTAPTPLDGTHRFHTYADPQQGLLICQADAAVAQAGHAMAAPAWRHLSGQHTSPT